MAPFLSYASTWTGYLSLTLLSLLSSTLITLHPPSLQASIASCRGNHSPMSFASRSLRSSLRTATKKTAQDFPLYRGNGRTSLSQSSFGGWLSTNPISTCLARQPKDQRDSDSLIFDTSGFASSLPRTHASIVRLANPGTSFISKPSILSFKPDGS